MTVKGGRGEGGGPWEGRGDHLKQQALSILQPAVGGFGLPARPALPVEVVPHGHSHVFDELHPMRLCCNKKK